LTEWQSVVLTRSSSGHKTWSPLVMSCASSDTPQPRDERRVIPRARMTFPETGAYVIPGALVPVEIDRERDEGIYVEPNVWMVHPGG
jgi:hypothetical protein